MIWKKSIFPFTFHVRTQIRRFSLEAEFDVGPFKLHKLEHEPPAKTEINKADAIFIFRHMQSIRRMENLAANLYMQKRVRGFCHLYVGQEAIALGLFSLMRPEDCIITSYRCHAYTYLSNDFDFVKVIAELLGTKLGVSKGKSGSMHMFGKQFYGGHGIVGAMVPLGAGVALALHIQKSRGACFCLYGDGASNQGQIFEAFNMAQLLKLPVVFICENNLYGMGTPCEKSSASTEFYKRGDYIPGLWANGMDVFCVRAAIKYAIKWIEQKNSPLIIEFKTYRYFGHSMSDPGTSYRTRDEVQKVRSEEDPINLFVEKVKAANLLTDDEVNNIDNDIKNKLKDALKMSEKSDELPLEHLAYNICMENTEKYVRGISPFEKYEAKYIKIDDY